MQYSGVRLVTAPVGVERRTDDRGNYRLWGLYDGTYLLRASFDGVVSGGGRHSTYAIIDGDMDQIRCNTVLGTSGVSIDNSCSAFAFQIVPTALDDRARVETRMAVIGRTEFFLTGLFGPTAFRLRRAAGDDWYLKSFSINGVDISDTGYDFGAQPAAITDAQLVLSRNGASISGRLGDSPVTSYFVVAFPVSRDARFAFSRRVRFARAGADGTFRIQGLPPGDYFVAAIDLLDGTADGGEWQNPDLHARLEPGAERVILLEGQTPSVSLRLIER